MKEISSSKNEIIKKIKKLRKANKRKREGLMIIEGRHEISVAQEAGIKIKTIFLSQEFKSDDNFLVNLDQVEIINLEKSIFKKISLREKPDGYLALAQFEYLNIKEVKISRNPLIVILENIEKPGNLGAIFRTCDACNVDLIIINQPQTDIYNHNVIRASLGTVFSRKIVFSTIDETVDMCRKHNIKIFASAPAAQKIYFKNNFKNPTALVVGTEHEGLSQEWLDKADYQIKIPLLGKVDSLNASVSVAVLLYEAIRQRI